MPESPSAIVDEDARRRFESAWAQGRAESIERYLPPPDSPGYAGTLLELALIELEMAWKSRSGPRGPSVEEYLARFPVLKQPSLLSRLLKEEYLIRYQHGETPVADEYRARFPDLDWTAMQFETAPSARRDADGELPTIPGLEIIGILGRGGMGVVYKARQTSLNRTVAVKQILPGIGPVDAAELSRFRNEAHAVARLRHPNIVQVHEVGEANGRPFLVLEFVDGGTLAKKLAGEPQPPRAAAELIATLARAVQAVHGEGLLHRDLKPGNILLSSDGVPKITDFGLTKRVDAQPGAEALTETGAILGTPSYMAPEQASGRSREVGIAADVYSLGAILYEALAGHPPFRGSTAMDIVMQVVEKDPVSLRRLLPKTPRDLETICLKCLDKNPSRRYASAAELADDLDRFLAGEPIRARPAGSLERGWRWCRRKPAQAALVAFVVLAFVGGAVGWVGWRNFEHEHERQMQAAEHANQLQAAEHRRQLQAAEQAELRKKLEDELQRKEKRRDTARTNRDLAIKELQAGRFDAARQFLKQASDRLVAEKRTDPFVDDIAKQYDRVDRLTSFYVLADRAERLAFLESDERALRLCDDALRKLGVFDHADDWWTKLPADELRPEQAAKLVRDADHQITLLASLWIKEGQESGGDTKQKALDVLKLGERYREANKLPPSIAGRILEAYVYGSQFRFDKIRRLDKQEPRTGSDCYFVGIALFWTSQVPSDWISQAVTLTLPALGVEVGEPKKAAERMLRRAVAEEPGHFWSHFWLGWCMLAQKNFDGAELAFTGCTSQRPEDGLAYAERARVLAFKAMNAKEGPERDGLVDRVEDDAKRARLYSPSDWYVQQPLLHAYFVLGRQRETLAAAGRALDLMTMPHLLQSRLRTEQESALKEMIQLIDFKDPVDLTEIYAVGAMASVLLKKDDDALRFADKAAETKPDHPRVHVVRGILHLRKKELPAAAKEFEAALAVAPKSYVANSGLCRTLELSGKAAEALRGYEALLTSAETDGQRLGAHLGCYRNLTALGRVDEAQKELANARAIDPKAGAK